MASGDGTPRTYSISGETAGGAINGAMLRDEILAEIAITTAFSHINTGDGGPDVLDIYFAAALGSGEITALDAVVAAHQGTETTREAQDKLSAAESTNDLTDWIDKIDVNALPVKAGDYLVSWYAEVKTDTPDTSAVQVRLVIDDGEKSLTTWPHDQWHAGDGTARFAFNEGDTPRFQIQFRRMGAAATVTIRRAYVLLSPIFIQEM